MATCDLRPGAPSYGTCRSLTGDAGRTCAKQDAVCASDHACCPYLKCSPQGGAAGGERRCTFTPEYGALTVNFTLAAPTVNSHGRRGGAVNFTCDPDVQHGLVTALNAWLLHEGSGADSARIVGYEPLRLPTASGWAADPTYSFELRVGAGSAPALANALRVAESELQRGGGRGACGLGLSSYGPRATLCSVALVRRGVLACLCWERLSRQRAVCVCYKLRRGS